MQEEAVAQQTPELRDLEEVVLEELAQKIVLAPQELTELPVPDQVVVVVLPL
jgi:hypothetical protein